MTTTVLPAGRTAAITLIAGTCGWILIGIVHPTAHGGDVVRQLIRGSTHLAAVHLLAVAAATALLFGLVAFSMRRGLGRSAVLAALVVYALASVAFSAAAAIDGFIVSGIASLAAGSTAVSPAVTRELLGVCGLAIQVFTKGGFLGASLAIAFWSFDLATEGGVRGVRGAVGLLGFAVAVSTVASVLATQHIGPHALVAVALLQSLWYAGIAALLAFERV